MSTLAIPFELVKVFSAVKDIFSALPMVVQFAMVACLSLACVFSIIKLLF